MPELPGTASFVHPTVRYNPELPPAAFPTLDHPRPLDTQPTEVMAVRSRSDTLESDLEQDAPTKRATIFHGKQQSSCQWLQRRLSFHTESEDVQALQPKSTKLQKWGLMDENRTEPGEYDGWGVMVKDSGNNESLLGLSVSSSSQSSYPLNLQGQKNWDQYMTSRDNSTIGLRAGRDLVSSY